MRWNSGDPRKPRMAPVALPAMEWGVELKDPQEVISTNSHMSFREDPGLQVGKQLRQH